MALNFNTTVWAPRALAALRVIAGLLFLAHGVVKLLGFPAGTQPGQVELFSFMGLGGLIELVAGALIMLGVLVRPAAFVASGTMAVAYWMFHAPSSPFPVANGGDAAILYCFIFLYLSVAGGGSWQLRKS